MNKCWTCDQKSHLFYAQSLWFKLPLIMSGCWNKRVGSSYIYGVMVVFSNACVVITAWVMSLLGICSLGLGMYDVWVWLIVWLGRWNGSWCDCEGVRIGNFVIYFKEDVFGVYSYVETYICFGNEGLRCWKSYTLYTKNEYGICWRSGFVVLLQFWLYFGFSEQLGAPGGFELHSLIDMEASVKFIGRVRMWHVLGFTEFWWSRIGLRYWFRSYVIHEYVYTCIGIIEFLCCWCLQWTFVGIRRWPFIGVGRGVSTYFCLLDQLDFFDMGIQSSNGGMVVIIFVESFWLRRRFAYCSGLWVCVLIRFLSEWFRRVDKCIKTIEEGSLVADGTSGESLVVCPLVEIYLIMLVPRNVGEGGMNTNRDLLALLLVRLVNDGLIMEQCNIKRLDLGYVLFQVNHQRGSEISVAPSCVGFYVLIKWDLGSKWCSVLLRVWLSTRILVTSCLILVYRNTKRLFYDMIRIRDFMYFKFGLLVAYFLNLWSYTIVCTEFKHRHGMGLIVSK